MKAKKYTYHVIWSEEDKEFIGLCREFPFLSWIAPTQEKALWGIIELVKNVLVDMNKNGEKVPVSHS